MTVRERGPDSERERLLWALALSSTALLVRAFHVLQMSRAPFFGLKLGDAASYDAWARTIAAGDWLGSEVFYQAPLYPYFLGTLYAWVSDDLLVVKLSQAVLGAISCGLLGLTAWNLFGKRAGIAAGLVMALYGPAFFYESLIQKSVLDVFFLCWALWLWSWLTIDPRLHRILLLGAATGCLALVRENALILVPPLLLWLLGVRPSRRRFVHAGVFLAGLALLLGPVALRNRAVGGELHLTTSQLGPNLFIGNNPEARGTYESLRPMRGDARYERRDATEIAEAALGRRLTPGEVSSYYTQRVLEFVRSRPGDWLWLMARKAVLLWNAVEVVDTEDQYTYAEWSLPLRLLGTVFHFGVLAPVALLGIWSSWRRRDVLWLLYAMLALYAASVVAFYVFGRYRLPMVPFLVLFAGVGVTELGALFRSRSASPALAVALAAAVLCNWPLLDERPMRALTHYNFATEFERQGNVEEAARQYRLALALDRNFAEAHNNLGNLLFEQRKLEPAEIHFLSAVRIDGEYADAHNNLGNLLVERGELEEAVVHLERAIRTKPEHDAKPHYNLGNVLLKQGRLDEAIEQYELAVAIDPGYANAHYNWGNALFRLGRLDEAAARYERTLEIDPEYAEAHNNLGIIFATRGELALAADRFERALRIDPDYVEARENLARAREGL